MKWLYIPMLIVVGHGQIYKKIKGQQTSIKRTLHGTKKRTLITAISNALYFNQLHIN